MAGAEVTWTLAAPLRTWTMQGWPRAAPRERARCGKLVKRARSWRGYAVPLPARQPHCQAF